MTSRPGRWTGLALLAANGLLVATTAVGLATREPAQPRPVRQVRETPPPQCVNLHSTLTDMNEHVIASGGAAMTDAEFASLLEAGGCPQLAAKFRLDGAP